MRKYYKKPDLKNISSNEEAKLVSAIIKIAYIIFNSGIIVGEKLEMPSSLLFQIRLESGRASGYANPDKFITRDLDNISEQEKEDLKNSIKFIAKITNNNFVNVAKKLEMPDKFIKILMP